MDLWEAIETRHSIRDFRPDPVPREVIERVVRAGMLAPSSFNLQPWHFHVTTGVSRAKLGEILAQTTVHLTEYMDVLGPERYAMATSWYSSLGNAPVVIGVSAPVSCEGLDAVNTLLALGAATEHVMLAATAEGLGTCSVTFAWWVKDQLAQLFGLSPEREVVVIVALGYPSDMPPAAPEKRLDAVDWLD